MTSYTKKLLNGLHKQWKEGRYTDASVSVTKAQIRCHSCVIAAVSKYIKSQCMKNKEISLQKYSESAHVETLISKLYSCENLTLDQFRSQILPIAKYLKIDFLIGVSEKIKNVSNLNQTINEKWMTLFQNEISVMRKSGFLSDVKIKVEDGEFKCHKAILAATSTYFDTMFQSGMKEALGDETVLHGLDKRLMEKILDYIYTGEDIITVGNVESVLSASVYMQLTVLQMKCEKFLVRHLDPENCIGVLRLAETFSSDSLRISATSFILRRFDDISKTREFLTLTKDQLIDFIKDNNLNVSDELTLFGVVIKWFDNALTLDKSDLEDILKHVRLRNVDEITMDGVIRNNITNRDAAVCKDLVKNAISKEDEGKYNLLVRHHEVLMLVKASPEQKGIFLSCYSFVNKKWYELDAMVSYKAGCSYAACGSKNELYVSGGSGTPCGFICYKGETNQWIRLENLADGRSDHMTVATQGFVYVLGGSKPIVMEILSDISRYITSGKVWRKEGHLSIPVSNAACAVLNKQILIFGGNMSFVEHSNHIQCFDTITKSCSVISRLPMICSFTGITQDDDVIYLVCPEGQVIRYIHEEKAEVIGKAHSHCLVGFGVVSYNKKILVLGGNSTKFESDEVETFDLTTNRPSRYQVLKLPWKKQSNQYFGTFMWISKAHLSESLH